MNGLGSLKTCWPYAINCYPCHRTVPVWSMAQQIYLVVSNIYSVSLCLA